MQSAGNFHPEWGYLAPRPSFMRAARVAAVAAAIGAVAGSLAVVSLVSHSRSKMDNRFDAARALMSSKVAVSAPVNDLTDTAGAAFETAPALASLSPDPGLPIEIAPAGTAAAMPPTAAANTKPDAVPARKRPLGTHRWRLAHTFKHPRSARGFARSFQLPHNSGLVQFDRSCCGWTTPPARRNALDW